MASLEYWIDPEHLSPGRLEEYRQRFAAHPARLLFLPHFLADRHARALADMMATASYARARGLSSGAWVSDQDFRAAADGERMYRYEVPSGFTADPLAPCVVTYLRFRTALATDPQLCGFFRQVTGLDLAPSRTFEMHRMQAGDFLARHDDRGVEARSLALVLYLTGQRGDGGTLLVHDLDGGVTAVQPEFNSLVMFDVRAQQGHEVTPIAAGAPTRLSISGWYLDAAPPAAVDLTAEPAAEPAVAVGGR